MIEISTATLTIIGSIIAIIGAIFAVFFYFQKPQIAVEKRVAKLEDDNEDLHKQVLSIRDDHSKNTDVMQKDIKDLTSAVNELSKTVVRLSTIIDERIPKGTPTLTPPGV